MPPKVDVAKLMADLAAQKSKLLAKKAAQESTKTEPPVKIEDMSPSAKAAHIQKVKERVAAQLARNPKLSGIVGAASSSSGASAAAQDVPKPLLLDEQGREVDEKGNLVQTKRQVSSLANQRIIDAERRKKAEARARELMAADQPEDDFKRQSYYDSRVPSGRTTRTARSFAFVKPGTYVRKAEQQRTNMLKAELQAEAEQIAEGRMLVDVGKTEDETEEFNPNMMALGASKRPGSVGPQRARIPDVEWWDEPFLKEVRSYKANLPEDTKNEDSMDVDTGSKNRVTVVEERITHYVEHPVRVKPLVAPKPPPPIKVMLTAKERKKLRKRNRAEREAERQERVLLGLEEAPKARVRIANMMKARGNDAIQDPTQVEAQVRREMAARQAAHDARNQARKLTPAQRKEKKRRKLVEDTKDGVHVAVFRVEDLSHPQRRFKVDASARDNQMTGCALLTPTFSLVVVEGGPKSLRHYKRLLLQRIDWTSNLVVKSTKFAAAPGQEAKTNNDDDDDEEPERDCSNNRCVLAWEGIVAERSFKRFSIETAQSHKAARFYLREAGVEHYYNIAEAMEPQN